MTIQPRPRHKRAGYTLVEVMIAIGILTVSATAIFGMQEVVIRGNSDARDIGTATSVARATLELLRLDALNWTQSTASATTFAPTRFMRDVPTAPGPIPSTWLPFGQATSAIEHAYDMRGDPTAVTANMRFCVESRFAWIFIGTAVRADVRVWWVRTNGDLSAYMGCPAQTLDATALRTDLHFVQASTVLRYSPGPVP